MKSSKYPEHGIKKSIYSLNFSENFQMLTGKRYFLCFLLFLLGCIFAVKAQQPELVLPIGHTGIIRTARFSPDGKYVITGGADKQICVWETFSGKKVRSLGSNNIDIIYAFFSNDGKYIAVGTDSSVIIWSVPGYVQWGKFDNVRYSLFSPDSKRLFLTGYNGSIKQVDLGTLVTEYEYNDHVVFSFDITRSILKVAVSHDNKWVATAADSLITIREIKSGKIIAQKKTRGTPVTCFFSYDGLNLVVVTDKGIKKIELKNNFVVSAITEEAVQSVFLSSNNKFLVTNNLPSAKMIFWDFEKYKPLFIVDTIRSGTDTIMESDKDDRVTYKIIKGSAPYQIPTRLLTFTNINIDDGGKYFWTMSYLWNNKDFSKSYRIENNYLNRSDISHDGKYLLTQFNEDGAIHLWDIKAQKIVQSYQTHAENITISEISPDGTKMLTGGENKIVKVSFVQNGQPAYQLEHKDRVAYAAFSKNGKNILTNCYDSTARLWDAASGRLLQTFNQQYPETNPAYFSGNGNIILTKLLYDSVPVYDMNDVDKITGYSLISASYYTPKGFKKLITKESKSGRYSIETIPYRQIILKDSLHKNNFTFEAMPLSEFTQDYIIAFSSDEKMLVFAGDGENITLLIWNIEEKNGYILRF